MQTVTFFIMYSPRYFLQLLASFYAGWFDHREPSDMEEHKGESSEVDSEEEFFDG